MKKNIKKDKVLNKMLKLLSTMLENTKFGAKYKTMC